jgi:hypothetical protein
MLFRLSQSVGQTLRSFSALWPTNVRYAPDSVTGAAMQQIGGVPVRR